MHCRADALLLNTIHTNHVVPIWVRGRCVRRQLVSWLSSKVSPHKFVLCLLFVPTRRACNLQKGLSSPFRSLIVAAQSWNDGPSSNSNVCSPIPIGRRTTPISDNVNQKSIDRYWLPCRNTLRWTNFMSVIRLPWGAIQSRSHPGNFTSSRGGEASCYPFRVTLPRWDEISKRERGKSSP